MWHILSSDPGCGIYVGFKNDENILLNHLYFFDDENRFN